MTPASTKYEKDAEVLKADAESKARQFSEQAKDKAEKLEGRLSEVRHSAEKKFGELQKDAPKELNKAVDAFDKNVQKVSCYRASCGVCILLVRAHTNDCRALPRQRAVSPAGSAAESKAHLRPDVYD